MNHAATAGALACLYRCGMRCAALNCQATWQKYHYHGKYKRYKSTDGTYNAGKKKIVFGVIYCKV